MEQNEKNKIIRKINRQFHIGAFVASFLYLGFLFLSNLFLVIIDTLYVHDKLFVPAASIATTIVILLGWRFTLEEKYAEYRAQLKKVSE